MLEVGYSYQPMLREIIVLAIPLQNQALVRKLLTDERWGYFNPIKEPRM